MRFLKSFVFIFFGLLVASFLFNNCFQVVSASAPILDEGLVLYLPFDEGSGLVAHDFSPYHTDGTITGAVFEQGVYGTCLGFNGAEKVTVLDSLILRLDDTNFSICFWYKANTTAGYRGMVAKDNGAYQRYEIALRNDQKLWLETYDGAVDVNAMSVGTADSGDWRFVVGVVDRSSGFTRLYINGTDVATTYVAVGDIGSNRDLYVGYGESSGYFSGLIDDVRIYNRLLSQSEITFLFENPLPSPTPSPSPTSAPEFTQDYVNGLVGFAVMSFLLCFNLVSLVWFRRVPLVVYLVGFFTFVVGVAVATSGFIGSEFGHYYVLFVVVMAGMCMLLVGLGVRVGGRR